MKFSLMISRIQNDHNDFDNLKLPQEILLLSNQILQQSNKVIGLLENQLFLKSLYLQNKNIILLRFLILKVDKEVLL